MEFELSRLPPRGQAEGPTTGEARCGEASSEARQARIEDKV